MDRRLTLLLPIALILSIFASQTIPNGHAGGYNGTGLVCITYPATATNCSNSAASVGPVTVGSSFTVGVFLNNSQPMGGFDIYVAVNSSYLNPTNAVLGSLITSPTQTTICINGSSITGSCTGLTANGPGVVEVSTVESSGTNECGNTPPCSGLAFNITYNVVGTTASTPIFYPIGGTGCSTSSVASPTDVCVLVGDSLGNTLPENIQGARVTQTVTTNPTKTVVSCTSPVTVGVSTSCTATVNDTAATGATNPIGQVTFSTSVSGNFSPLMCTLSPVGTRLATCAANYTPTAVGGGTHNIGASYSGDTVHTGSTATAFSLSVSPSGLTLSNMIISDSTGQPVNASRGVSTGASVHEAAVLVGGYPITGVSGTVTYYEYASGYCAGSGTFISKANVASADNVPISKSITLSTPGTYALQALYSGDGSDLPAAACVSVNTGSTTTTVVCSPSPLAINSSAICVATVIDLTPNPVNPSGMVSFTTNSTATFTPTNSCTLTAGSMLGTSSCSLTYVPTTAHHHSITGGYAGDSTHVGSANIATVTVTFRATTAISCSPISDTVGTSTTCTATVTDTSSSPTAPSGTVSFGSDSSGGFSTTSCTLAAGISGASTCSVTYTPTSAGNGSQKITATYSGDTTHASNSGTTSLTVSSAPASPNIQLSPLTFYSMIGAIVALAAVIAYLGLVRRGRGSANPTSLPPSSA